MIAATILSALVACLILVFTPATLVEAQEYDHTDVVKKTYDYIVVGAGSAGSIVAARLAQAGHSVLLLEAGPNTSPTTADPADLLYILQPFQSTFGGVTRFNFKDGLGTPDFGDPNLGLRPNQTLLDYNSLGQGRGTNGSRYYTYPRGTGAGGSSQINAMVDGTGSLKNYDNIAELMQDPYWAGDNMLRIFKKMENHPLAASEPAFYGANGWLQIKRGLKEDIDDIIFDIADERGIPFTENERRPGSEAGAFYTDMRVGPDGFRSYSYKDLLLPTLSDPKNKLTVKFNSFVEKVLLREIKGADKRDGRRHEAYGVQVYEKPYLNEVAQGGSTLKNNGDGTFTATGTDRELPASVRYYARKEVILSAGAINTPKILMLSGIGHPGDLSRVGLKTMVHLPGVGKDLSDHPEATIVYEMDPAKYLWGAAATVLSASIGVIADPDVKAKIVETANPAYLTQAPVSIVIDWFTGFDRRSRRLPDFHAQSLPSAFFKYDLPNPVPIAEPSNPHQHVTVLDYPDPANPLDPDGLPVYADRLFGSLIPPAPTSYFSWLIETFDQGEKREGSITLGSADPRVKPVIDLAFYRDEEGLGRLARAMLYMREFMNHPEMKALALDPDNYEVVPGKNVRTLKEMKEYLRTWSSWGHHVSGTAQMGPKSLKNAVVDHRLRVYGVRGLRVADTSIYPKGLLHRFNPDRGAFGIGEACAEFIVNPSWVESKFGN